MLPRTYLFFTGLLAACSEPTIHSACYANGPHDRMSDGRIVRMCDCVVERIERAKLSPAQTSWAIDMLRGRDVEVPRAEQDAVRRVSVMIANAKNVCELP